MRQAAQSALSSATNLAFLGANACYRQIRLNPSFVGTNRLETCYKDAAEDPVAQSQPSLTTVDWNQAPLNDPETSLIGSMYQSVGANADLVVTDGSAWFWHGLRPPGRHHAARGRPGRVRPVRPLAAGPDQRRRAGPLAGARPGQLVGHHLLHRPAVVAASLATGMASFVFKLSNTTEFPSNIVPAAIPGVTDVLLRAMENVFGDLREPGRRRSPSPPAGNGPPIYRGAAALAPTAQGTNAA